MGLFVASFAATRMPLMIIQSLTEENSSKIAILLIETRM